MNTNDQAVDRTLFDYVEILYRRRWPLAGVTALVFGAFALYAFYSTPVYRSSSMVVIEKPLDVSNLNGGYIPPEEDYIPTQAKILGSETALKSVFARLDLGNTPEFSRGFEAFRNAVTVLPVPRTRLITISAESVDPQRAADIVRALADRYVKENPSNEQFMSRKILAQLDSRMRRGNRRLFYESLPVVAANAGIQNLKDKVASAAADLARLRATLKDDHPSVVAASNELAQLRSSLDAEEDAVVSAYRAELSGQFHGNNVRVVDAAEVPRSPVRPRRPLALLMGLLGGLALGCITALCVETLDQTVRTHSDVERGAGLPLLGHIPLARFKRGEKVYAPLIALDMTSLSEAFRNLRTMVLFAKAADPDPFLLVTSAVQGEGKSFVATNLAVALAQLKMRVLLIDGDLRRPSQHRMLEMGPTNGLSDILAGRVKDPEDLVQRSEIPNLDVLPGGLRPPNPSELLSGEQLEALVAWARERYDRVVIDCPPVFPVSDILLWGRHIRSSILVSRSGRTPIPLIQMACTRLRGGGIDVLGGVINGTPRGALSFNNGHDFDRYCRGIAQEIPGAEPS